MTIPTDLHSGYRDFRAGRFSEEEGRYRALSEGQSPKTMIIGCADSRVDPATIFSAGPGELFVVRNVAALVPPCEEGGGYHGTSAALEFAVEGLRVRQIVIMGHGLCGGVAASLTAAEGVAVGRFIGPWVGLLEKVRDEMLGEDAHLTGDARQRALEHLAVKLSLENLRGFPFVQKALDEGRLTLHGAWFSIAEGQLQWLDQATGKFAVVEG
ncbi:MAG: carbonic anhydrase [Beijerinckiaceae bacterium]